MPTTEAVSTTIRIPTPLRSYADGQSSARVEGRTVGDALRRLVETYPDLKSHLYKEDGSLRSFVNIYLGDEDVRHLQKTDTPLNDGDELSIIPSVAGGAPDAPAAQQTALSPDELRRYSRHLTLPEFGRAGQEKLKSASALVVGAGGLGSPVAMYLAAAGIGRLGLVDFDAVEASNLQRQLLHGTSDVGRPKLESARDRLRDLNPHVEVELHEVRLSSENALEIIEQYDIVADGTDNFPTRYLVNDACVLTGTPNVYASIFRFEGQVSVFCTEEGPCYRCVYEEPPPPGLVPSCADGGVLGVLPGLVGTIQATEVIKMLTGIGEPLIGRLLLIDALSMEFRTLRLRRNPEWPAGAPHPTITELIDYEEFCGLPQQNGTPMHNESSVPEITVQDLKRRRDAGDAPFVLDVRKPYEAEIANIGADRLIPVEELGSRLDEVEDLQGREVVVHCRSGGRSAEATKLLREHGYDAKNLKGGTLAWSKEIDNSVPEY